MTLVVPVFDNYVDPHLPVNATVVGHLFAIVPWITYFKHSLQDHKNGLSIHVTSPCGTNFRLFVQELDAHVIEADEWDSSYDQTFVSHPLGDFVPNNCNFTLTIYPTAEFEEAYMVSREHAWWVVPSTFHEFSLTTVHSTF
jgi:hypothetical protein